MDYSDLERLARGATGEVWKAQKISLNDDKNERKYFISSFSN